MKIEDQIKVLEEVYGISTHIAVEHIKQQQALIESGVALPLDIYKLEVSPLVDWLEQLTMPRPLMQQMLHVRTVGTRRRGARTSVHKFNSLQHVVYVREEPAYTLINIETREEDDKR